MKTHNFTLYIINLKLNNDGKHNDSIKNRAKIKN